MRGAMWIRLGYGCVRAFVGGLGVAGPCCRAFVGDMIDEMQASSHTVEENSFHYNCQSRYYFLQASYPPLLETLRAF